MFKTNYIFSDSTPNTCTYLPAYSYVITGILSLILGLRSGIQMGAIIAVFFSTSTDPSKFITSIF